MCELVRQWNPGTCFALLDEPGSGTQRESRLSHPFLPRDALLHDNADQLLEVGVVAYRVEIVFGVDQVAEVGVDRQGLG